MTAEQFARAREIFLNALNQPVANRSKFVADQCAGDTSLQREVEDLLAAHLPTIQQSSADSTVQSIPVAQAKAGTVHFGAKPDPPRAQKSRSAVRDNARDLPSGTLIADRYRIVSRLGAGGMGEVFRAEDLTLEQPVALKFLPRGFSKSPAWVARLRQEARLARTVTHPNICRVHDLVESNGEYFLTMEYVDGEDLASLYHRIGRMPVERALDVARQICLGLAVAHSKNVLHRDLKPPNIMIDGQGQVRVTDFGVAAMAHEIPDSDIRTGTAAYMAPEQITGRGVSVQSDIYSLGLVLFELFTGHKAFDAETIDEFAELHQNAQPPVPSQFVRDIPPEVERIILQCLEKDPAARPASALIVAAALPGSNVLSDVVAAHLTPPPEVVALASVSSTRVPTMALLAIIGVLIAGTWVLRSMTTSGWDHLGALPPGSLKERARATLGDNFVSWAKHASGYCDRREAENFVTKYAPPRLDMHSPDEFAGDPVYWYREYKESLEPNGIDSLLFGVGRVSLTDPPLEPGSRVVVLDLQGRLLAFVASPDLQELDIGPSEPVESFSTLLAAADLRDAVMTRAGWYVDLPANEGPLIEWRRPESASPQHTADALGLAFGGRPVFFAKTPGDKPLELSHVRFKMKQRRELVSAGLQVIFMLIIAVAIPWAWRGYWSGRIDRDGAVRLAVVVFLLDFLRSVLTMGGANSLSSEMLRLSIAISRAMGLATAVGILFVVVDLSTRRYWPEILVTWNRAVRSQFRDAAVGRHIIAGVLVGCSWVFLAAGERMLVQALGWRPRPFLFGDRIAEKLFGLRDTLASHVGSMPRAIVDGLMFLLLLILVRMLTRNAKLAVVVTGLLLAPVILPRGAHMLTSWLFLGFGGIGVFLIVLTRLGLLPAIVAFFVASVLSTTPFASSLSLWYADWSLLGVAIVAGLALFGATNCRTSRAGAKY